MIQSLIRVICIIHCQNTLLEGIKITQVAFWKIVWYVLIKLKYIHN